MSKRQCPECKMHFTCTEKCKTQTSKRREIFREDEDHSTKEDFGRKNR